MPSTVAIVTLGCARNEVDSEEVAARLADAGYSLVVDPEDADAVLVNTCGFVDAAKKDSIDAILAAADLKGGRTKAVVAIGCLSERYGRELADSLPEADAVLGFDAYPDIADRLRRIVDGERPEPHVPRDRRLLLPISPVERPASAGAVPGHGRADEVPGWQPPVLRRRLDASPVAPVKLASGCDRRCSFCAIPSFRGAFVSRPAVEIIEEVAWLVGEGVREAVLVSENSTSYGKDLGDMRLLEALLPQIAATGIGRVRVAYLQPAEVRPGLLAAIAGTPGMAPYFDLSFQHASPAVLRRMRRFGGRTDFLDLIARIRELSPAAGIRSNVITGFPGETEEDFAELCRFLEEARLDAIGVFGYSDEEGTEAAGLEGKLDPALIAERVRELSALADELMEQRAEDRIGEIVEVLVEEVAEGDDGSPLAIGHAGHQGPDDATTAVRIERASEVVGTFMLARVVGTDGADLLAEALPVDRA